MALSRSDDHLVAALDFPDRPEPVPAEPPPEERVGRLRRLGRALKPSSWLQGFSLRRGMRRALPWLLLWLALLALLIVVLFRNIVVVVRDGQAGVLYRMFDEGIETEQVFGEGIHLIWPWDTMSIYNRRVQTVMHEFSVLTNRGLPISLRLAIRYYLEYEMIGVLHQTVGENYVNTIVIPQIESVLRRDIGRRNPEDIYTNKEGILTSIVLRAIEEAGQKFVNIDDIIIRSVELPQDVKDAIDDKIVQQQRWQAYEFRLAAERQEAERKRIEAEGVRTFNTLIAESLVEPVLRYRGVEATKELAASANAKVIVIGGADGLPLILNTGDQPAASAAAGPAASEPSAAPPSADAPAAALPAAAAPAGGGRE